MNPFHLDLLSNECFKCFMYYCMSVKVTLLTDVYKANLLLLNEHFQWLFSAVVNNNVLCRDVTTFRFINS